MKDKTKSQPSEREDVRKPPLYSDECKVLSAVNYKQCKLAQCENPMHLSNRQPKRKWGGIL